MTETRISKAPLFWVGLFFGVLLGILLALVWTHDDTAETYEEYRQRMTGGQSMRTGAAPMGRRADPGTRPGVRPPADAGGQRPPMSDPDRARESISKVHFMKKFVAALTRVPDNKAPATDYEPLLASGAEPISCRDCHQDDTIDAERMRQLDPGSEAVEPYRQDRGWMIEVMQNWVARLNNMHGDRLREPVTCMSCHEIDPRDGRELVRVYPPLMVNFVSALREPPKNRQPASNWKPLLREPQAGGLMCGTCHGPTGERMAQAVTAGQIALDRPEPYASNKEFMVHLMEEWVSRLNREMGDQLVKTVGCKDCHETDPRR